MKARRLGSTCVLTICVALAGGALSAQSVIRQGGEFQVNRYTVNNQYAPAIALAANGDFVVSWTDAAQEINGGRGIFAARFNSAGAILGGEFHVNTYTNSIQHQSSVAAEANGDFVIVWQSFGQAATGNYTVFGQRFDSSGAALGSEFQVSASTVFYLFVPKISSDADGDFVVVWDSSGQDGSFRGIFGRRFNSAGAALGAEFMVNTFTNGNQRNPSVALDSDGDFVVVWDSFNQDGQVYGVFGKRFSSAGVLQSTEFQVNTFTTNGQSVPAVAAAANGDFVVAWQSLPQDGSYLGIFGRRFSAAGAGLATEFQVNQYTTSDQRYPGIAADDSGDFVVSWESRTQDDGTNLGIFARRYSASGTPMGGEFQVNSYTFDDQWNVTVDWDSDGDFVIAWQSDLQDPGAGVFAQRFSLPPLATLDVDGNGVLSALTDGLLILRKFFGFTSDALTSGVVGSNCTRCDAASISSYITGLGLILDIDNNGSLNALTDGLLCVRFLFGFTGTTLTGGDVAGNCVTRCDAATILPYLQTLD